MQPTSIYPVIQSMRVAETAAFYTQYFGFYPTFESAWYISLRHTTAEHYELAIVDSTHSSVPTVAQQPTTGLILNIEVGDVDAVYEQLITHAALPLLRELSHEAWGQRHFITADPNGVLIDVITTIAPSQEFSAHYTG